MERFDMCSFVIACPFHEENSWKMGREKTCRDDVGHRDGVMIHVLRRLRGEENTSYLGLAKSIYGAESATSGTSTSGEAAGSLPLCASRRAPAARASSKGFNASRAAARASEGASSSRHTETNCNAYRVIAAPTSRTRKYGGTEGSSALQQKW